MSLQGGKGVTSGKTAWPLQGRQGVNSGRTGGEAHLQPVDPPLLGRLIPLGASCAMATWQRRIRMAQRRGPRIREAPRKT